ncbi:uncharacterized protein METZ01_LOCUS54881 [marine metagenome]|uniref:Uncharacterized protein n=1 Tax=marine metagenome TaxID=408172 RepID=A0A381SI57_9ZZZZ
MQLTISLSKQGPENPASSDRWKRSRFGCSTV